MPDDGLWFRPKYRITSNLSILHSYNLPPNSLRGLNSKIVTYSYVYSYIQDCISSHLVFVNLKHAGKNKNFKNIKRFLFSLNSTNNILNISKWFYKRC